MTKIHEAGQQGEVDVCELVPCPNCSSKLMLLPPGFPLVDIQCTRCQFRAQVKTANNKPRGTVFGAGWDIYEKVFKAGFLSPPLFVNFKWTEGGKKQEEIRLFPFVPKKNVVKYQLSSTARRANYRMFRYVGLDKLPHFVVYKE